MLISPISFGGFEIRDLQVRVLAKYIFFSGLLFGFAHSGTLCEHVRDSMSQVVLFMGKGETRPLIFPV